MVYTFYDSTPASSAPVVTGTLSVSPGNQYSVKVEIYLTDLDASSEYATTTIGGKNMGDCNPNFSAAQSGCYWYDCSNDLSGGNILASSGQIAVVATYTSAVGCCTCAWEGVNTLGIIRITLTQGNFLFYHLYDRAVIVLAISCKLISFQDQFFIQTKSFLFTETTATTTQAPIGNI